MTNDANEKQNKTKKFHVENAGEGTKVPKKAKNTTRASKDSKMALGVNIDDKFQNSDETGEAFLGSKVANEGFEGKKTTQLTKQAHEIGSSKKNSIFIPMLFGGLLAGIVGFVASYFIFSFNQPMAKPASSQVEENVNNKIAKNAANDERLESSVNALQTILFTVQNDLRKVEERISLKSADLEIISILEKTLKDVVARVETIEVLASDMTEKVSKLENRSEVQISPDNFTKTYNEKFDKLKISMDILKTEVNSILDAAKKQKYQAEEVEKRSRALSLLNNIREAVKADRAFSTSLQEFEQLTKLSIPKSLRDASLGGIVTMEELLVNFPDAARLAISVDRSESSYDGTRESLFRFLKIQLQARSVVPKVGDDTDAILSRAEAALKRDELHLAIKELTLLKPSAKAVMAQWTDIAQQRLTLFQAINGLVAKFEE